MLDCFSSFIDVFALRDGYDSFGGVFLEAKTEGIGEENWDWIKFLRGTKQWQEQWIITMLLSRIFLVLQIMEIVLRLFKKKKKVEVGEYLENIGKWKIYHARDKRLAV